MVGVADRFDVVSIGPGVIAERQVPRFAEVVSTTTGDSEAPRPT